MSAAEVIVAAVEIYAWIGVAVAAAFLIVGIDRVDPASSGAYVARILFIPGIVGLWPLVLWRWWVLERARAASQRETAET